MPVPAEETTTLHGECGPPLSFDPKAWLRPESAVRIGGIPAGHWPDILGSYRGSLETRGSIDTLIRNLLTPERVIEYLGKGDHSKSLLQFGLDTLLTGLLLDSTDEALDIREIPDHLWATILTRADGSFPEQETYLQSFCMLIRSQAADLSRSGEPRRSIREVLAECCQSGHRLALLSSLSASDAAAEAGYHPAYLGALASSCSTLHDIRTFFGGVLHGPAIKDLTLDIVVSKAADAVHQTLQESIDTAIHDAAPAILDRVLLVITNCPLSLAQQLDLCEHIISTATHAAFASQRSTASALQIRIVASIESWTNAGYERDLICAATDEQLITLDRMRAHPQEIFERNNIHERTKGQDARILELLRLLGSSLPCLPAEGDRDAHVWRTFDASLIQALRGVSAPFLERLLIPQHDHARPEYGFVATVVQDYGAVLGPYLSAVLRDPVHDTETRRTAFELLDLWVRDIDQYIDAIKRIDHRRSPSGSNDPVRRRTRQILPLALMLQEEITNGHESSRQRFIDIHRDPAQQLFSTTHGSRLTPVSHQLCRPCGRSRTPWSGWIKRSQEMTEHTHSLTLEPPERNEFDALTTLIDQSARMNSELDARGRSQHAVDDQVENCRDRITEWQTEFQVEWILREIQDRLAQLEQNIIQNLRDQADENSAIELSLAISIVEDGFERFSQRQLRDRRHATKVKDALAIGPAAVEYCATEMIAEALAVASQKSTSQIETGPAASDRSFATRLQQMIGDCSALAMKMVTQIEICRSGIRTMDQDGMTRVGNFQTLLVKYRGLSQLSCKKECTPEYIAWMNASERFWLIGISGAQQFLDELQTLLDGSLNAGNLADLSLRVTEANALQTTGTRHHSLIGFSGNKLAKHIGDSVQQQGEQVPALWQHWQEAAAQGTDFVDFVSIYFTPPAR